MISEQHNPAVNGGTINDPLQRKRVRTGSISGRLRTASDLEEIGMIDKYQKGYIKDLIISGDSSFQAILEKYEKGDKRELEELIRSGFLGRRQSIDLLDDLDFDFLNGMKADLDVADAFGDDFMFDFAPDPSGYAQHQHHNSHNNNHAGAAQAASNPAGFTNLKARTASMDSTGSFSFFESLPYDANNANSLMDELQYLNRQYAESASAPVGGQQQQYPRHVPSSNIKTEGYKNSDGHHQEGAPHVSFSRYVSSMGLDPSANPDGSPHLMTGHKGRRDSWDIAAQYIQQEEDFSRGQGSAGARSTGSWATAMPQTQGQGQQKGGMNAGGVGGNKPSTVKKTLIKADGTGGQPSRSVGGGGSSSGNGAASQQGQGQNRGISGGVYHSSLQNGGQGTLQQQQQQQLLRPGGSSAGAGGTGTSTQHSSYLQQGQMMAHGSSSSSGGGMLQQGQGMGAGGTGGPYDDVALRLGGPGFVGAYSPEQRRLRIEKFIEKRGRRVWTKKVKYDVRKNFADSRLRVKGRFVKKEDEDIMREILSI